TDSQAGRVDRALHYQFDLAASIAELLGRDVPSNWDGVSFAEALRAGSDAGRDHLVLTQGAWTCQRAVRFADWCYLRTYHDGYHELAPHLLFDVARDPHLQANRAGAQPDVVAAAEATLADWHARVMQA